MIYVTQLVYVNEGCETTFQQFEEIVLPLLAKYRGELLLRLRPTRDSKVGGSLDTPYELHVVRFEEESDLVRYAADEERQRCLHLKDQSVRVALQFKASES
ncbi:MAG TPA: hypothetical protein VIV11_10845 [Kofleriaceae bacterium]